MEGTGLICMVCQLEIEAKKHKLFCSSCHSATHRTCLPKMSSIELARVKSKWSCSACELSQNNSTDVEVENDQMSANRQFSFSNSLFVDEETSIDINTTSNQSSLNSPVKLPKGLKFAHVNINGIKGKFSECVEFLDTEKNVLVLGITESKLDPQRDSTKEFQVRNYNLIRRDRENKEGGGTLLYVHNSCDFSEVELPNLNPPSFVECTVISVKRIGMKLSLVCIVYAPPYAANAAFCNFFRDVCEFLKCKNSMVYILGDFNINLLESSCLSAKLNSIKREFDFFQIIDFPTRIATVKIGQTKKTTSTLLDHIYVSSNENLMCGGLEIGGSDHLLTYVSYKKKSHTAASSQEVVEVRNFKNFNYENFELSLAGVNWNFLINERTFEVNCEIFEKQVLAYIEEQAPIKKCIVKNKSPPWITDSIKRKIKSRNKLMRCVRNGEDHFMENYKQLKNEINILKRKARKTYFRTKFNASKSSTNIWDLFNELTNFRSKQSPPISKLVLANGDIVKDKTEISHQLAKEYIVEGSNGNLCELTQVIADYENSYVPGEFELSSDIMPYEILSAIKGVKKCKNDNKFVPLDIYKRFALIFVVPLTLLFTSIVTTGIVPQMLKLADCFPLYKGKGKHTQASSYRAIFNMSCFTKIFERFLYNRLMRHCFPKFNDKQHGFRVGRSCQTAVSLFTESAFQSMDKTNGKCLAVFVDFKKAFDSVDRTLLIKKMMREFLVPPYLVKIFHNFYSNRKFRILNGNTHSDYFSIDNGTGPGSCLGPLQFSLFINDIGSAIDINYLLYADDVIIYTDCTDMDQGHASMQNCLSKLEEWCNENNLVINTSKTKAMYFFKARDIKSKQACSNSSAVLTIYGEVIEFVSVFKYLGVNLDCNLNFKLHYTSVEKKMNMALRRLYSLRRCFSESVMKTFLSSFVSSILDFSIEIWCVQTDLEIMKLQNKISRFLVSYYFNWGKLKIKSKNKINVLDLYARVNLQTIIERRKFMLLKFAYKFRTNKMFREWFRAPASFDPLRPKYELHMHKSSIFKNSIKWNLVYEWNALFSNRSIIFDEESPNFNFVDLIMQYLLKFRSNIYLN